MSSFDTYFLRTPKHVKTRKNGTYSILVKRQKSQNSFVAPFDHSAVAVFIKDEQFCFVLQDLSNICIDSSSL